MRKFPSFFSHGKTLETKAHVYLSFVQFPNSFCYAWFALFYIHEEYHIDMV